MTISIDTDADIQVGRPLPRETVRAVESGYLVTCTDLRCQWQGLFPDPDLAATAVERHYEHEQQSGSYHFGNRTYLVIELVNGETACSLDESRLGLSVEEQRYQKIDGSVREAAFPRTTGSVADLVERGDRIRLPPDREYKVMRVSETRSHGLPTWSVVYCDLDADMNSGNTQPKFKNEMIARDGDVYCSYGEAPLAAPAFDVIGQAEHQASVAQFVGGGA